MKDAILILLYFVILGAVLILATSLIWFPIYLAIR